MNSKEKGYFEESLSPYRVGTHCHWICMDANSNCSQSVRSDGT